MQKIVNKLINESIKGVDTYSYNGSTWIIFTESKEWVIELTESKTLWYNYNFFKNIFNYVSMDVVDNQHYITQWVEDNIINVVKDTILEKNITEGEVEEIIEMGVKETNWGSKMNDLFVEDTIKNGVKETNKSLRIDGSLVIEDTIENGVKETMFNQGHRQPVVKNIIQNGVKETIDLEMDDEVVVEDIIENGVKETHSVSKNLFWEIGDTLQNGVKDTQLHKGIRPSAVGDAIENGVKRTSPNLPKYEPPVTEIIEKGILKTSSRNLEQFGIGYTLWKTETITKEGVKEIKGDSSQNPMGKVSEVIDNGIIETKSIGDEAPDYPKCVIGYVINNGVKETKTPGNGDLVSTVEWMKENNSTSYPKMIEDVIENGVKEIKPSGCVDPKTGIHHFRIQAQVDNVVDNGVKEIKTPNKDGDIKSTLEWMYKNNYQDDYNGSKMINNVIENGIKKVQPLPEQSGELRGYGDYYNLKENRTKPFIEYIEETIKFGVKENLG